MGIISSITSFGGQVWGTVSGGASTAYSTYVAPTVVRVTQPVQTAVSTGTRVVTTAGSQVGQTVQRQVIQPVQQQVIQPIQTRVIQPVQQQVIQPIQTRIIQPVQQRVIQPVAFGINLAPKVITSVAVPKLTSTVIQPVQQRVIQPVQQRVVQPALAGVNLAPKIATSVIPRVTQAPQRITSAVVAGASMVPFRSTQISVTQPVTGMGGLNTRPSLNILGSIPAAAGKVASTGLGAVTSLKSAAGAGIRGAGNVTQDLFGVRSRALRLQSDALQAQAAVYNQEVAALKTESGWFADNMTQLNTFIASRKFTQGESDQINATAIAPMQAWGADLESRIGAKQNESVKFNQTAAALETQKQQVESTGLFGFYKGSAPEDRILGIIPNPLAKYNDQISSFLAKTPMRAQATRWNEEMDKAGILVNEPKSLQGPVPQFMYGIVQGYAEDAQKRPTKFVGEMAAGFTLAKGIGFASGPVSNLLSKAPGAATISTKASAAKSAIPIIKNIPAGKLAEGALLTLYGAGTTLHAMEQPTPLEAGKVFGRAGTELTGLYIGGAAASRIPIRGSARAAYDITAKAGTRIIETQPFQTGSRALGTGWERAFGRVATGKVQFAPGRGVTRGDPVKMDWNRATRVFEPSATQTKSRWDFLRVDRAAFAKAQPQSFGESNWQFIEANHPSVMSDLRPGTGWLNRPASSTRNAFVRTGSTIQGIADRGQMVWEAKWQQVYDRPYSNVPGSEVYLNRDPKIQQFFARQAVRARPTTVREPFRAAGQIVEVKIPRPSARQVLADRYPSASLETQLRAQLTRRVRTPSQTKSVDDIAQKISADDLFIQARTSLVDTLTAPKRLPSFPRSSPTSIMTMKIGSNRVFPLFEGTTQPKVRVSEGMKAAVQRGQSNVPLSQLGKVPETFRGDVFEYNTGLGPVRLTRTTKPPVTPLSEIFGKPTTAGKPSSATAIVIPKEKPVAPPAAPKEMGSSTAVQDMNRALGVDTATLRGTAPAYAPAPTGAMRPGETMDAYGIDIPTARKRRIRFFDDDTMSAYGPMSLGGAGAGIAATNLRDQFDTATDRARGTFSGISIIPTIALIGETGLGSRTTVIPAINVKTPEPQKYDPVTIPKLRLDPIRAQAPTLATITAPQFDVGQLPGLGQINLQTPAIGQVNLQMPAMDQLTLQQPAFDQMQIQRPVTDTFIIRQPAFEPPTIPPFDIPIIPVIPPFTPPPMGGAGGGGGGGAGGFRTGFEFTETMPLGDFLSDTFGGAGLDFGGMNDVSSASFMSGAWGGAKPPRKTKRRKR